MKFVITNKIEVVNKEIDIAFPLYRKYPMDNACCFERQKSNTDQCLSLTINHSWGQKFNENIIDLIHSPDYPIDSVNIQTYYFDIDYEIRHKIKSLDYIQGLGEYSLLPEDFFKVYSLCKNYIKNLTRLEENE